MKVRELNKLRRQAKAAEMNGISLSVNPGVVQQLIDERDALLRANDLAVDAFAKAEKEREAERLAQRVYLEELKGQLQRARKTDQDYRAAIDRAGREVALRIQLEDAHKQERLKLQQQAFHFEQEAKRLERANTELKDEREGWLAKIQMKETDLHKVTFDRDRLAHVIEDYSKELDAERKRGVKHLHDKKEMEASFRKAIADLLGTIAGISDIARMSLSSP